MHILHFNLMQRIYMRHDLINTSTQKFNISTYTFTSFLFYLDGIYIYIYIYINNFFILGGFTYLGLGWSGLRCERNHSCNRGGRTSDRRHS